MTSQTSATGLAKVDYLFNGLEIAHDLPGCVADSFHGGAPCPVWLVWPLIDHAPAAQKLAPLHPCTVGSMGYKLLAPRRNPVTIGVNAQSMLIWQA